MVGTGDDTHIHTHSSLGQSLGGSWIGFGAWSALPLSSAQGHNEAWSAHCSECFLSERSSLIWLLSAVSDDENHGVVAWPSYVAGTTGFV